MAKTQNRIKLKDSPQNMIVKLSEGNPGAAVALTTLFKLSEAIDPDSILSGLSSFIALDDMGIYGTDIYVLFNDICNRSTVKTVAVLRAKQLGYISGDVIADAASRQDYSGKSMIDVIDLYNKVKKELPAFADLE
jgi:hypothetical protein